MSSSLSPESVSSLDISSLTTTSISEDDLHIIKPIQQDRFSVYLVMSRTTKQAYAIKVFPYKKGTLCTSYLNEQRFSWLNHPNIINVFQARDKCSIEGLEHCSYILMEYSPYGDFHDLLVKHKFTFYDKILRTYFHQLVEAISYLHTNGIAHMDIKPQNLLLTEEFQLKLIDFDLAYCQGDYFVLSHGTKYFRAPEVVKDKCLDPMAADIFSMGVLLFALKVEGRCPFLEDANEKRISPFELLQKDREKYWAFVCEQLNKPPEFFDEDFKTLFEKMTKFDPKERPKIEEIKQSNWYKKEIYSQEELKNVMIQALF